MKNDKNENKALSQTSVMPSTAKEKLDIIFNYYTQRELAIALGITQWKLLEKIKNNSFTSEEIILIKKTCENLLLKKVNVYGVEMTPIQEMKFSQFLQRPETKAMNTLTKKERYELVKKWKDENS